MIIELDKLDHTILLEEEKTILLLIVDPADIWVINKGKLGGFFSNREKQIYDMNAKHSIYLCKKIENYVNYIANNGLINNFPEIEDTIDTYKYEIRVVTQFNPEEWYLKTIEEINKDIKTKINKEIIITNEIKEI